MPLTPLLIGGLGMQEVLLIALVILLFFGGKKIPEMMNGLGKGVRSFKAFCAGILCASPYILYQLFRFVFPALYTNERKYVVRVVGGGYLMFALGVLICYFLIFPLTFRFLGDYHVSGEVENI